MFTDSPVLICGWLSIDNMKKLFQTIKSEDFNVQSDAIETTQQLFGTETRTNNSKMTEFVNKNMDEVLHLFYNIYKEIDPDDLDEEADEQSNEEEPNFFELKELMKIEYQLLQDYRELREHFSNHTEYLKQTLNLLNANNNGVEQEAILMLSIFILMPNRKPEIIKVLVKNKA